MKQCWECYSKWIWILSKLQFYFCSNNWAFKLGNSTMIKKKVQYPTNYRGIQLFVAFQIDWISMGHWKTTTKMGSHEKANWKGGTDIYNVTQNVFVQFCLKYGNLSFNIQVGLHVKHCKTVAKGSCVIQVKICRLHWHSQHDPNCCRFKIKTLVSM